MTVGIDVDAALVHIAAVDERLATALEGVRPVSRARPREPYAALLRAIVGQQLSMKAVASIWARVEAHFDGVPSPAALLATDDNTLRALGLSRQKSGYMKNVAQSAVDGALDAAELAALDDAALIARLTAIKGVGRWTVEMIMMFGMQRPDVFSAGDLGVQQAMQAIYGLEETGRALERRMRAIAEPWSPHRTAACRLLWAWHEQHGAAWKAGRP